MKKILFATVAGLMLVGPLSLSSVSAQPWPDHQGQQSQQNQQPVAGHTSITPVRSDDMHAIGGRDQHHPRQSWRDQRTDARWDDSQHNGYYQNNRWHYGQPTADQLNVQLGYHPWARGQRLGYYNTRYQEVDYRQHHLRRPSHGYHWVEDNNGDYLLAAIAGGLIAQVVFSNN